MGFKDVAANARKKKGKKGGKGGFKQALKNARKEMPEEGMEEAEGGNPFDQLMKKKRG